ncbi:MAG TPA: CarD family transcriptional regulator [Anaerolineales bacterium]|nr:CarD family transcriptional regulator [Anaerolineales bacterium]
MANDPVMTFEIGDQVVHPQHGVGKIVKVDDRAFGSDVTRKYYEVSIEGTGSTLWVPLDPPSYGLRKLATKKDIDECRKVLASQPEPLSDDARSRQSNLAERLKEGKISVQCEVVRDLYAFGEHKSLYGTIANFFRQTQDVLCEEWALVEGIPLAEAVQEVTSLLEKSRKTVKETEA